MIRNAGGSASRCGGAGRVCADLCSRRTAANVVYRWLAVAVVVLHFAYRAYLAAGGFLAWRWPRTFAVHGTAAIWGGVIVASNAPCPRTVLQNMLRTTGGQQELETTFVDTYVRGVLFPADQEMRRVQCSPS